MSIVLTRSINLLGDPWGSVVIPKTKKKLKDLLSDYEYVRWNYDDKRNNKFIKKKKLKAPISRDDKQELKDLLGNKYKYLLWNANGSKECKPFEYSWKKRKKNPHKEQEKIGEFKECEEEYEEEEEIFKPKRIVTISDSEDEEEEIPDDFVPPPSLLLPSFLPPPLPKPLSRKNKMAYELAFNTTNPRRKSRRRSTKRKSKARRKRSKSKKRKSRKRSTKRKSSKKRSKSKKRKSRKRSPKRKSKKRKSRRRSTKKKRSRRKRRV